MEEAFRKPKRKAGNGLFVFFVFLVSFLTFILSYDFISVQYAPLITVIVFLWAFGLLWRIRNTSNPKYVHNKISIISVVEEVQHTKDEKETGREIVHSATYLRVVDFNKYVDSKGQNKNIAIIGMAGSGKTQLTYYIISQMPYKKIIFQYKNSDRYRELGYPVLFLNKFSPNVFHDKEAFTQAWLTAFAVENRGITASQIIPLVRNAVNQCNNWQEFKAEIEKQAKAQEGTITGNALTDILLKLDSVYSEKQYEIAIPDEIVIDFEGLNKDAFVFYAEYLLRELYEEIKNGTRVNTMIFVDEAHVFTKANNTIIPELSAIIRSRGAFLFATQRASSIAGDIKGNAGTQFCFKQTERDDLNEVSALSEPFHWIVQRLRPFEFVDLAQPDSHQGIYTFMLIRPKVDFKPVSEWKPESPERKQEAQMSQQVNIDYLKEIIHILEHSRNVQDIAKILAQKFRNSESKEDIGYYKLKIKGILAKMVINNEIIAERTENVKFKDDKDYVVSEVVYSRKAGNPSDYHEYLVNSCADILNRKGIIPHIQPSGIGTADIETDKIAYEIETGLKNDISDIGHRIEKYRKAGQETIIIVSNKEAKAKYEDKYPNIKVLTLVDLWRQK